MLRRIIVINEEKCSGCGLCAKACHEGAIGMSGGKAKLLREDYCDGLGDCLPACPQNAITFEMREAPAYDAEAVEASKRAKGMPKSASAMERSSYLHNFPVQIKLAPVKAPHYDGADLLIAADCTAFADGDFHRHFMKERITLIGCSKLDGVNYAEKLAQIFMGNDIGSITVARMTVPCCGGLVMAVQKALEQCGKPIPCQTVIISTDGTVMK